jgi:hypothetical protein
MMPETHAGKGYCDIDMLSPSPSEAMELQNGRHESTPWEDHDTTDAHQE